MAATLAWLAALGLWLGGAGFLVPTPGAPTDVLPAVAEEYQAPLRTAVADLTVAEENRTGYQRTRFRHWTDEDDDGCSTRVEVLLTEADDPATLTGDCRVVGGRWYSYYDGRSWTDPGRLDIDHMVPLAEAWDSGARSWTPESREHFANDLGDRRSLVAVTGSVNRSKADQDPGSWMPQRARCRYLREWVAVKHRWALSVDEAEMAALTTLAAGCPDAAIRVVLAEPQQAGLGAARQRGGLGAAETKPRATRDRTPRPRGPQRPTNRPQPDPAGTSPQAADDCPRDD